MQRIAFFGGTFDPPHAGHLAIARAAADRLALNQVLFAPVAQQPLKAASPTPFEDRFAMVALATHADPRFIPSLLDAPAHGPTHYTIDTLERLQSSLAAPAHLFTLLGADSWLQIARWHNAPRLLGLTDWIVAARPGFPLAAAAQALPPEVLAQPAEGPTGPMLRLHPPGSAITHVYLLPDLAEDISATELRAHADDPTSLERLLPVVQQYIHKRGLYR